MSISGKWFKVVSDNGSYMHIFTSDEKEAIDKGKTKLNGKIIEVKPIGLIQSGKQHDYF
jgi:hypothetical protein